MSKAKTERRLMFAQLETASLSKAEQQLERAERDVHATISKLDEMNAHMSALFGLTNSPAMGVVHADCACVETDMMGCWIHPFAATPHLIRNPFRVALENAKAHSESRPNTHLRRCLRWLPFISWRIKTPQYDGDARLWRIPVARAAIIPLESLCPQLT
jgi:hypothetical protein